MDQTLLILLAGHLVADFVFQTGWMVRMKRLVWVQFAHAAIVCATTALLLGATPWALLAFLGGTHLVIDLAKAYVLEPSKRVSEFWSFAADQALHIAVIVILAIKFPGVADQGYWAQRMQPEGVSIMMQAITGLCALILCVPVGGIMVAKLIRPLDDEIQLAGANRQASGETEGLKGGGRYIGWLERGLVLLLVIAGQPAGVGFLVAAKSLLRYGDIQNSHQRRLTEYIIIGTFLSFGWALLIAYGSNGVIEYWQTGLNTCPAEVGQLPTPE